MEFQNLKQMECPVCGCNIIASESLEIDSLGKIREHTNGERWEKRQFACGQIVTHVPNYRSMELSQYDVCQRDQKLIAKRKARSKVKDAIIDFIDNINDVDDNYKTELKERILTCSV